MRAKFAQLHHIEYHGPVQAGNCGSFLAVLQSGLILALEEMKVIDHTQCQSALEQLDTQAECEEGP